MKKKTIFTLLMAAVIMTSTIYPCVKSFALEDNQEESVDNEDDGLLESLKEEAVQDTSVLSSNNEIEKTQVFITDTDNEDEFKKYTSFAETITKDGNIYTRNKIEYEIKGTKLLDTLETKVESAKTPSNFIKKNGLVYELVSMNTVNRTEGESHTQRVLCYTDYDQSVSQSTVPATKTTTVVNEVTGVEEEVTCNFAGIAVQKQDYKNETIKLSFTGYGADYYEWKGFTIPARTEKPLLSGYENELLKDAGYGNGATVIDVDWSGNEYIGDDGVPKRDAVATVKVPYSIYRANYEGVIETSPTDKTLYVGTYRTEDPNGEKNYTILATATYVKTGSALSTGKVVGIGAGCAAIMGLLLGLIFFLKRDTKKRGPKTIVMDNDETEL